jgi:hypothetical protein
MFDNLRRETELAIRECVTRCSSAAFPLACLAQFCSELRSQGWSGEEIHRVEAIARRMLAAIMGRENETLPGADVG